MDGNHTINPFDEPALPHRRRLYSPADWLSPEFSELQRHFDAWQRDLNELAAEIPDFAKQGNSSFHKVREIAATIAREVQQFRGGSLTVAEPEDLRRLLNCGQRLTGQLAIRITSRQETQLLCDGLADLCHRLLHEPRINDEPLLPLVDAVRRAAAESERPWIIWDSSCDVSRIRGVAGLRERCGDAAETIVTVGVAAARTAARVARRLEVDRHEAIAAIAASLLQDCGRLLVDRSGILTNSATCGATLHSEDRHPRYGAALAAGLSGVSTAALGAIAGHHSPPADTCGSQRVHSLVAVISGYVEELLRTQAVPREDSRVAAAASGFPADVLSALHAELATGVLLPVEPSKTPGVSETPGVFAADSHSTAIGRIPAPHAFRADVPAREQTRRVPQP